MKPGAFEVVPFAAGHLAQLSLQPAQQVSLWADGDGAGYAEALAASGYAWTGLADGRPIACAGIVEQWRGRGLAWALLSTEAGGHFVRVTRAVQRALDLSPLRRIEMHVDCHFAAANRWAEMLGFQCESVMRSFNPEGRDAFMYVRIR